jgi:hypothetical protein
MKLVFSSQGSPGATRRIVSADAAQGLPAAMFTNAANRGITGVEINVENNAIRVTFGGAVPTSNPNGLGHNIPAGGGFRVYSPTMIRTMQFINTVVGADGVLQVSPEYEVS